MNKGFEMQRCVLSLLSSFFLALDPCNQVTWLTEGETLLTD